MPDDVKDALGDVKDTKDTSTETKDDAAKDDPIKKIDQKFSSWMGRIEAQQKEDRRTILAKLDTFQATPQQSQDYTEKRESSGMKALNDQWAERILQGDVSSVLEEYTTLRRSAEDTLSKRNANELGRLIANLEEGNTKYIKEVKADVQKMSANLVGQGYSPQDAVAFAYEKSRADHLDRMVSGGDGFDPSSLETLSGGSRHEDVGAKKGKLNAEGKKAFEKNKSYFKDDADFIASMSPRVKERFVG
uniref:Uncharacterized protein n=1 Tax=viral metagenome TaxID=1070528 RepID=A0A6M3XWM6_9ZZZZ